MCHAVSRSREDVDEGGGSGEGGPGPSVIATRSGLTVSTLAQRHPHIGADGILVYSDDDNDSFADARSPPPRTTPKKGADKRVSCVW